MNRRLVAVVILAVLATGGLLAGCTQAAPGPPIAGPTSAGPGDATGRPLAPGVTASPSAGGGTSTVPSAQATTDAELKRLFETQQSNVMVTGAGTVARLLADDTEGDRHQRFILRLGSGQTLLVAHNIDIAPRLNGLAVGDRVAFRGEYVYTDQGGTIHWTHHDPKGTHVAGWLEWDGRRYG